MKLEQIVVDGRKVEPSGTITLAPDARALEIEAMPILLSSQTSLQIRRNLIGFDEDWSKLSTRIVNPWDRLKIISRNIRKRSQAASQIQLQLACCCPTPRNGQIGQTGVFHDDNTDANPCRCNSEISVECTCSAGQTVDPKPTTARPFCALHQAHEFVCYRLF